jgi:uncharacterized membrane protein YphA (DoxX/SURF4 family)
MAEAARIQSERDDVAHSVWLILRIVFGVVPIVAGLDKFFDILVVWDKYLAHPFASIIPVSPHAFMYLVGIIEIIAGIGVLFTRWTRLFAWIVAIWLWCIAIDLIVGGFYDIAVRDIVMGISSMCLARLTAVELAHATTHSTQATGRPQVNA